MEIVEIRRAWEGKPKKRRTPVAHLDSACVRGEKAPLKSVNFPFSSIPCHLLHFLASHAIISSMDPSTALASRLASDEDDLLSSLSVPSPSGLAPTTLSEARTLADRLLLEATPSAIRTLRRVATSGDDKPAVAAASKILDKSPATRDLGPSASAGLTLPPEAFSALVSSLAALASAALQASPSAPFPSAPSAPSAPAPDPITVEVIP